MMKLIMSVLLAAWLTGCTYNYYPAPGGEVYTDEEVVEEPTWGSRDYPAAVEYSESPATNYNYASGYASSAYYPWWSVDYFYLSGGYVGSGIHVSVAGHYPRNVYYPYYYPRYSHGWYSPYYHDHYYYRYSWGWYNPYRHHRYRSHYPYNRPGHHGGGNRGNDRYVDSDYYDPGRSPGSPGNSDQRGREGFGSDRSVQFRPGDRGPTDGRRNASEPTPSIGGYGSTSQYVTAANAGTGNMTVRSREGSKPGRSRLHPVTVGNQAVSEPGGESSRLPDSSTGAPVTIISQSGNSSRVRYQSGSKEGKQRTQPVGYGRTVTTRPASGAERKTSGLKTVRQTQTWRSTSGSAVRSAGTGKSSTSRTQPISQPIQGSRTTVRPAVSPAQSSRSGSVNRSAPASRSSVKPTQRSSSKAGYSPSRNLTPPRTGGSSYQSPRVTTKSRVTSGNKVYSRSSSSSRAPARSTARTRGSDKNR